MEDMLRETVEDSLMNPLKKLKKSSWDSKALPEQTSKKILEDSVGQF